ncbi:MAG: protein-L-isoaspartate(D-aspartate) O-methyltransferase [Bacteroidota bacterium]
MIDTFKHKGLRRKLAEGIRDKGIADENVLAAIEKIPRHLFMDSSFLEFAYQDKPFPIGEGQTISQPYTVAFQSQILQVKKGMKVLEIGTGSGYQACVLIEIGAKVFSVERIKSLFQKTKNFLPTIGYNPRLFFGDGYKGLPAFAPFDRILVTAGAPHIPEQLIKQLKPCGILVIPLGEGDIQIMTTIEKKEDNTTTSTQWGTFRFVPLLNKKES